MQLMNTDLKTTTTPNLPAVIPLWRRPVLILPASIGTLSIGGYFVLHHPFIFISLALISFGFFTVSFFGLALANKGLQAERQMQAGIGSDEEKAREIRRLLGRSQYEEMTSTFAERGVEQVEQATTKMKAFKKVLEQKFEPNEFTSFRYLDAAREVYVSVLTSLEQVGQFLIAMATLKEGQLLESQRQEVKQRLDHNEKGLLALDEVTTALSRVDTGRGLGGQDLDSALAQLQELAARAGKYSKTNGGS